MRFRGKSFDRELERRLRAERPTPRDEFVRSLTGEAPVRGADAAPRVDAAGPRRRGVPRLVLLAGATALVAVSLGVAGALGSAASSLHSLGSNVVHIVSSSNDYGSNGDDNYGGNGDPKHFKGKDPSDYQYHHKVPICDNGQIIYVPFGDYFWLLKHGDKPAIFCFRELFVFVIGHGSVSSNPSGINCPVDCSQVYAVNTLVTLTEKASPGSGFVGWTGDCTGTSPTCTVTMSQLRFVTAHFRFLIG